MACRVSGSKGTKMAGRAKAGCLQLIKKSGEVRVRRFAGFIPETFRAMQLRITNGGIEKFG